MTTGSPARLARDGQECPSYFGCGQEPRNDRRHSRYLVFRGSAPSLRNGPGW